MITDLHKHIDENFIPHTGAGTMALYFVDLVKEHVEVPSGIAQLDDDHPAALQLIFGNTTPALNLFIKDDGRILQVVVEQGELSPTAIFIPHEDHPDQISDSFVVALALTLFGKGEL